MAEIPQVSAFLRRMLASLVFLTAAGLSASAAEVRETFDAAKDPARILAGSLLIGEQGNWIGALQDGGYQLSNATAPGTVRYSHLGLRDGSKPASVSVDVTGRFDGGSAGAGLIYRFDAASKGYFAFVLTAEGYALFKRGPNGFSPLSRGSNKAVRDGAANRLTVQLDGTSATLLVNGARVLGHKSDGPPAGTEVGLIAIDLGVFRFDNFELVTE